MDPKACQNFGQSKNGANAGLGLYICLIYITTPGFPGFRQQPDARGSDNTNTGCPAQGFRQPAEDIFIEDSYFDKLKALIYNSDVQTPSVEESDDIEMALVAELQKGQIKVSGD